MKKAKLEKIFEEIRKGCSLYGACQKVKVSTLEFYQEIGNDEAKREAFRLALSDYADQCTDDIRTLALSLKCGEIDNSTAKLLIETQKWLAQKACPEPVNATSLEDDGELQTREIVVKFV